MTNENLVKLLSKRENAKLEFKREMYNIYHEDGNARKRAWDEFIKDVLSLANGNVGHSDETGYLIIGADDKTDFDGNRELIDVGNIELQEHILIDKINGACNPTFVIPKFEFPSLHGQRLFVILIPPSKDLYETTRSLETKDRRFNEHTVLIRHAGGVRVAKRRESQEIEDEKRRTFACRESLNPALNAANGVKHVPKEEDGNVAGIARPINKVEASERLDAEGKAAMLGLAHPLLSPFLEWYYGVQLWTHDGQSFPAVVFTSPAPVDITHNCEVLQPWDCEHARASTGRDWASPVDREFVLLRGAVRTIRNRQTFCLDTVQLWDGIPTVKSDIVGYYEDCLATSDVLEAELLAAFATSPPASSEATDFAAFSKSHLPLRQAAITFSKERGLSPFLSGAGRSSAIAVSTLTLAKVPDGSYVTFVGHRSAKTAAHPDLLHVVPSGMLQPIWDWELPGNKMDSKYYAVEWSLRNHVLREVVEELLGIDIDEKLAQNPPETPYVIFGHPEVEYLNGLFESGGAKLLSLGVLVNLLNLRAELVTILLISDPSWYEKHSKGISGFKQFKRFWEFLNLEESKARSLPNFWGSTIWTPDKGDCSSELMSRIGTVTRTNFVVPGAVTFLLGLQFARQFFVNNQ